MILSSLSKSYGVHTILNNVSFVLNGRIGLVGANGVGKSTLLKIITGELEADSGEVTLTPGNRVGYLEQQPSDYEGKSIDDLIVEATQHIHDLESRMRELEQRMADGDDDAMMTYGDVAEQFERYGGYELAHNVEIVLVGLGIDHIRRDRLFSTLSGGEKARFGLAMLLLQAPVVLLLDEPTNHLDFNSLRWLEDYLQTYRGAMLIVSHDRYFLNRTVNAIIELDEHTHSARRYTGNYDAYHRAKMQERQKWRVDYAAQQDEIKMLRIEFKETSRRNDNYRAPRDNDKFIPVTKKANHERTVAKRIRSAEEKLRRIEADPILEPPDDLRFKADFDVAALKGRSPLSVAHLSKQFGARCVLNDVNFALNSHSRVTIIGPNGAGKSTLLKILTGYEQPDGGEVAINPAVKIGYLDQEQHLLDPDLTVFEAYQQGLPGHEQQLKAILLSMGLFRYDELDRQVGQLSSGQQRKLQIARLIAGQANLLILDEPTNSISFDVLEGLEEALQQFPGPIIAATHDRHFIERFGGVIWELQDGTLTEMTV